MRDEHEGSPPAVAGSPVAGIGLSEPGAALDDPRTLAAVLASAPEGVVLFDQAGTIADWSPAAERILGYTRDRALGRNLLELVFPLRLRPAMGGVIRNRGAGWGDAAKRSIEVSLVHSSGEEIPIELSLSWAAGSSLFAAHLRDARERGERERELASEARRRTRLIELGGTALTASELDPVLRRALRDLAEELRLTDAEIWERDSVNGELVLRSGFGGGVVPGARVVPPEGSRLAATLRDGKSAVILGEGPTPSPWQAPEDFSEDTPVGIAALLVGGEGVLGVISGSIYEGGRFSTADVTFMESVSMVVGSALERERFERSRERAEGRVREMVERLPAITYRAGLGAKGRWYYLSPQTRDILGYSPQELLEDEEWWDRRVHPEDLPRVLAEEERSVRESEELDVVYRIEARDGRTIWVRDRASLGRLGDGDEVVAEGLMFDITAQKQAEGRLRHLADHDALTDLLNRRGFESAVDEWLAAAGTDACGALAVLNIDHLKRINDSLGHAAGDAVLQGVARKIEGALREGDVFGRIGGDEFGLFLPGLGKEAAKRRFDALIELIRDSEEGLPSITASAGIIVTEGRRSGGAADLLAHADVALWQAKDLGRDRVALSGDSGNEGLRWVAEVSAAIEEGRLTLYGQPIVDLESDKPHSYELLARMIDRNGAIVPARDFIGTAERFGLIRKVDRWAVGEAVDAAAAGLRVCVNLSAASIADSELTNLVAERLRKAGDVDPAMITFEITETVATPTIEVLQDFAERVERLGCGLSLDDVGTGFGTLLYLRNLPFSQLKIDMEFVQGMLDSEADAGIVRSLVVIGRELGLRTIAEGVELAETNEALHELGVDFAQGYYLGKPTELEPLLGR